MDLLSAVDSLDDLIDQAKPVPLTDEARVDPGELARIVEEIRVAVPPELARATTSRVPALVHRLDALIRDAKPVPMTKTVRVDRETIYAICDQLRTSLPEDLQEAQREQGVAAASPARTVSAQEAARSLPELLHQVRFGGDTIRITLNGTPMADLRPPAEPDSASV